MAKAAQANIVIRAGERARILKRRSSVGLPATYRFLADPVDPRDTVSGIVEIRGAHINIDTQPFRQPLRRENRVERRDEQNVFDVDVIPDCDVTVTLQRDASGMRADFVNTAIFVLLFAGVLATIISLF